MYRTLSIPMVLLSTSLLFAQQGTVTGKITTNEGGRVEPMPFVSVVLQGTTIGGTTDLDGAYRFDAPVGEHVLQVSFVGYQAMDTPITVSAGKTTSKDLELKTLAIEMDAVEVVHKVDREREAVQLMERRESTDLVQNIGAQELQKKGAGDVAAGVQKLVGLSIVGGRYLYVRGMGDRYNSAYLNGLPLPSPDPDSKVAPLDIFPTSIVNSISVTKAFTPEYYGDFAGGAVDIRTKQISDEHALNISLGTGMNSQTTFKEFNGSAGGSTDFWGFDDGSRDLPAELAGQNPQLGGEGLPFAQNFNPTTGKAKPNLNFGLNGSTFFKLGEHVRVNLLGTGNYSNSYRYTYGKNRVVNTSNVALIDYDMESYRFTTQTSALGGLSVELGKHHTVSAMSMLANISSDENRVNSGDHFDYAYDVYARRYTFRQNKVRVDQVHGEHAFGIADRFTAVWGLSFSKATSAEPDRRQLVYLNEPGAAENAYLFNGIDRIENHRWFSALKEKETSAHAGLAYRIFQKEDGDDVLNVLTLRAGGDMKRKKRDFGYDIWVYDLSTINSAYPNGVDVNTPDSYLNDANYGNATFAIQNATTPEADHVIEQNVTAAYGIVEADLVPRKLKVMAGARYEIGEQTIFYREQSDSYFQAKRKASIEAADILPYFSVKYALNERNIIRLNGSKTISRPGFREMAPFEYTEFFAGVKNVGNPLLQNGTNFNADVRYEWYPSFNELLAIGAFGKLLQDPIEKVALATASGQLQSFENTQEATVAGVELEIVKSLGMFSRSDSTVLNDFTIGFNAAYLYSNVTIDRAASSTGEGATVVLTNLERPLQGASPYLFNADLSYTKRFAPNFKGVFTVAYNMYGRRVFAVGANGLGDQYELPLGQLNLILRGEIGEKWQASVKFLNVTNAEYRIEQENRSGTSILNSARTGVDMAFGLSYRIR